MHSLPPQPRVVFAAVLIQKITRAAYAEAIQIGAKAMAAKKIAR